MTLSEEEADDLVIRVVTPDGVRTIDVSNGGHVSLRRGFELVLSILAS